MSEVQWYDRVMLFFGYILVALLAFKALFYPERMF